MANSHTSKTISAFMAFVMLMASFAVSAGSLSIASSSLNDSQTMSMRADSADNAMENCHEMDTSALENACCIDLCLCDISGCQSGALVSEQASVHYQSTLHKFDYAQSSYLSVFSPPTSPPPIA